MKKFVYIPIVAGALALGGVAWANGDDNPKGTDSTATGAVAPTAASEEMLSFEEASAKALAIANGAITDIELDRDSRTPHYEIDIDHEGYEYDVKVDAVTGDVLEEKREKEDRDDKDGNKQAASEEYITSDEAVKAAQAVAEGTVDEVEFDQENGSAYYEVKIENGGTEHEVYVDALDGEILKQEQDDDDDDKEDRDDD